MFLFLFLFSAMPLSSACEQLACLDSVVLLCGLFCNTFPDCPMCVPLFSPILACMVCFLCSLQPVRKFGVPPQSPDLMQSPNSSPCPSPELVPIRSGPRISTPNSLSPDCELLPASLNKTQTLPAKSKAVPKPLHATRSNPLPESSQDMIDQI